MLIFHEGLPGSGKSYEAMVRHIIPAIQKGRPVFAYIEGIDHERVAQAAEVPIEQVRELLKQIARDDVPKVYEAVADNALVVLDEAQNFWPNGRQKLDPHITQFITEHRHRGLDLLLMGQDMRDVHALWRRRVSMRVLFNKLDAVGQERRYNVTTYKATAPEKFEKVSASFGRYDERYFGTYASHVADDTNTENYKDARASLANQTWVRWGIPIALVCAAWGAWKAVAFFRQDPAADKAALQAQAKPAAPPPMPAPVAAAPPPPMDYVQRLMKQYRPRLAMHWSDGYRTQGQIEWWDGAQVYERLTFKQLETMGYAVRIHGTLARLNGDWVTAWPIPATVQSPTLMPAALPVGQ